VTDRTPTHSPTHKNKSKSKSKNKACHITTQQQQHICYLGAHENLRRLCGLVLETANSNYRWACLADARLIFLREDRSTYRSLTFLRLFYLSRNANE
jgi:hypothetical protein